MPGKSEIQIEIDDFLTQRIKIRLENDSAWNDRREFINESSRFILSHLKTVYKEMMGENNSQNISANDIREARYKFGVELELIIAINRMKNQGKSDSEVLSDLADLDLD